MWKEKFHILWMLITIINAKIFSLFQPSSNALPIYGDCDKPFELGFNFMANRYTNNSILCNKCGLNPKYPAQGLCRKCYFEKVKIKELAKRTIMQ